MNALQVGTAALDCRWVVRRPLSRRQELPGAPAAVREPQGRELLLRALQVPGAAGGAVQQPGWVFWGRGRRALVCMQRTRGALRDRSRLICPCTVCRGFMPCLLHPPAAPLQTLCSPSHGATRCWAGSRRACATSPSPVRQWSGVSRAAAAACMHQVHQGEAPDVGGCQRGSSTMPPQ